MSEKTLIIGIGNFYRNDDSAGIRVVRKLKEYNLPHFDIIEKSGEGSNLMDSWQGYQKVMLIDAVSSDKETGTIHFIDANKESVPQGFFNYSTHAFSLAEAVELSKVLGDLPKSFFIYGIEGKDFSQGEDVSPEVNLAIEEVIKKILLT